jgi:hypothetical protein
MTAKITDKLKRNFLENIYREIVDNTDRYYVGIGRTEEWPNGDIAPDADNSQRGERLFRQSLQSTKRIADVSYVVTRYNWTSGTRYFSYDDATTRDDADRFYVLTDDNQVYICLQAGKNDQGLVVPSTTKPTGTGTKAFRTADNYVWKYMYTIGGERSRKFLTANYMPVEYIADSSGDPNLASLEQQQATIREAAVSGQILGIEVVSAGTGYTGTGFTSAPTVTIVGNGTGATARAFVNGAAITRIELDSDVTEARLFGSGYDYAGITITGGGGSGATARAIFGANDSGIGANPVIDLKATSIMFNTQPQLGEEGGDGRKDWPIIDADRTANAEYRTIGLIKNPLDGSGASLTADTGRVSGFFILSNVSDRQFFAQETLATGTGSPSGTATAIIDDVDSNRIHFHQTELTGFLPFDSTGGTLTPSNGSIASVNYSSAVFNVDVDRYSGEVFYIENRAAIERSAGQSEDIKIIVTL